MRTLIASLFIAASLAAAGCGNHTAGQCSTDADCNGNGVCNVQTSKCVACNASNDCPDGTFCDGNVCVEGCDEVHGCPSGSQCDLASHSCVGCTDDTGCSGDTAHCDVSTHTCVPCVASNDDCGSGQYCGASNTCVQGCKGDADCHGGTCLSDHSCSLCHKDSDCAGGKVCDNGACIAACDAQANPCAGDGACCGGHCFDAMSDNNNCGACGNVCATGTTCCAGKCVDTTSDGANCGACGTACGAGSGCCAGACTALNSQKNCGACGNVCQNGDFCDSNGTCQHPTYPNFCKNVNVFEIHDGIGGDEAAADTMASTVKANCQPGTMVKVGAQTDASLVNQSTGEPVAGAGVTYVTAGGPYPNHVLKWLERTANLTRVYFDTNGIDTYYWKARSNGAVVAQMPSARCNVNAYDQFVVELVTNPNNGTLSLIGYGACSGSAGTRAAAYYFAHVMLAHPTQFPDSWYVFEWKDSNMGDGQPGAGDTYNVLAHGM